jgi:hypothetical protein
MSEVPSADPKLGNEAVYPGQERDPSGQFWAVMHWGLTKRELFAAMAMQGILAGDDGASPAKYVAEEAVKQADALLTGLAK